MFSLYQVKGYILINTLCGAFFGQGSNLREGGADTIESFWEQFILYKSYPLKSLRLACVSKYNLRLMQKKNAWGKKQIIFSSSRFTLQKRSFSVKVFLGIEFAQGPYGGVSQKKF